MLFCKDPMDRLDEPEKVGEESAITSFLDMSSVIIFRRYKNAIPEQLFFIGFRLCHLSFINKTERCFGIMVYSISVVSFGDTVKIKFFAVAYVAKRYP